MSDDSHHRRYESDDLHHRRYESDTKAIYNQQVRSSDTTDLDHSGRASDGQISLAHFNGGQSGSGTSPGTDPLRNRQIGSGPRHSFRNSLSDSEVLELQLEGMATQLSKVNTDWGHFNVDAPRNKAWAFSPTLDMLLQEDLHSTNRAVQALLFEMRHSNRAFGLRRLYSRNRGKTILFTIVLCLGLLAMDIFWRRDMVWDTFNEKKCRCFVDGPAWWVLLFIASFLLLGQPGYVRRLLWSLFLGPLWGALHVYLIDPYLASLGSEGKLLQLYNQDQDDYRRKIYTPVQLAQGGRMCHYCGALKKQTLRCSQCRVAYYCNKTCQQKAWLKHRKFCLMNVDVPISFLKDLVAATDHTRPART
eukprot:g14800.t1